MEQSSGVRIETLERERVLTSMVTERTTMLIGLHEQLVLEQRKSAALQEENEKLKKALDEATKGTKKT